MYLYEVIEQKKIIDRKIGEIKNILVSSPTEDLAKELISLIDEKQTLLVKINIANNDSQVSVGSQQIKVTNAVILRDTVKNKVDLLTELIDSDTGLDKLNLIEQRDKYFNDLTLIEMIIKQNDLNVNVD